MSKAFDEWWKKEKPKIWSLGLDPPAICRMTWNAAIEAAAKECESEAQLNLIAGSIAYEAAAKNIRGLAAEEK